jgi:hypothetical protein
MAHGPRLMLRSVNGDPQQVVFYPVLELHLTYHTGGKVKEWTVPSCCFHDLLSATDQELAGMGLALIGNLIQLLGKELYDEALGAELRLKRHPKDDGTCCPWPGMPTDNPAIPLDLTQMPFETAMFLEQDQFKWRLDRLQLMQRIQATWVPWLRSKLVMANAA